MVLESSRRGRKGAFKHKGVLAAGSGRVETFKLPWNAALKCHSPPVQAQDTRLCGYFKGVWSLEDR